MGSSREKKADEETKKENNKSEKCSRRIGYIKQGRRSSKT